MHTGTLLNRLFGTNFDVMDETRRQQTTKGTWRAARFYGWNSDNGMLGIWMCRGKDTNVMVMDVEGTDGRERGEDQARVVAYCLSISSVFSNTLCRISNANLLYSLLHLLRCSSLTYGSIKSGFTRAQIWAYSKLYLRSTSASLVKSRKMGPSPSLFFTGFPLIFGTQVKRAHSLALCHP